MNKEDDVNMNIERHPLMTLGLLTVGSHIGSKIIQRLGKHPVTLFAMGTAAGVYTYKNRKEILNEAKHITNQGKELFSKTTEQE